MSDSLPTPCPQCGSELETRDDAMVHMFQHAGTDTDLEAEQNGGDR